MPEPLKLTIKPDWRAIEPARESAEDFLSREGCSADEVDALTMIISELIENAVKYGTFRDPSQRVELQVQLLDQAVLVQVIHPVDGNAQPHLQKLERTIQWIRSFQDPFEAYVDKLRKISRKPLQDRESGLGLFRIAYEGKGVLDFFVNGNQMLNISAISDLRGE